MSVIRLTLLRDNAGDERTFGALFDGTMIVCQTLEPGDKDVDHPRVPPGFYVCEPHGWAKDTTLTKKRTWALIGRTVSHQPEPGVPRAACLLHAGNRDSDSLGCILVGVLRGTIDGEPVILNSQEAMSRLRELIGQNTFYLTIVE